MRSFMKHATLALIAFLIVFGVFEIVMGFFTKNYMMQIAGCLMVIIPVCAGLIGLLLRRN